MRNNQQAQINTKNDGIAGQSMGYENEARGYNQMALSESKNGMETSINNQSYGKSPIFSEGKIFSSMG